MKKIKPLSGRGTAIEYQYKVSDEQFDVIWGEASFQITSKIINKILSGFFQNERAWYELGASMTQPPKDGLGEFLINLDAKFTSRHASAVAAILVEEEILESRGKRPILLRKKKQSIQ